MTVRIRLFAGLRHRAGAETIDLRLPQGATVQDALRALDRSGPLAGVVGAMSVQMAVNREYATATTTLREDDELALIPPVSGGAPDGADASPREGAPERADEPAQRDALAPAPAQVAAVWVRITERELVVQPLIDAVRSDAAGAIVVFEGVTREVPRLHYEAYREMAEPLVQRIVAECLAAHRLTAAAVEHRIGAVPLGQPSVIVAVSAGHREEAFAGARDIIDRVKAQAPIWKREILTDGSGRWIHD